MNFTSKSIKVRAYRHEKSISDTGAYPVTNYLNGPYPNIDSFLRAIIFLFILFWQKLATSKVQTFLTMLLGSHISYKSPDLRQM